MFVPVRIKSVQFAAVLAFYAAVSVAQEATPVVPKPPVKIPTLVKPTVPPVVKPTTAAPATPAKTIPAVPTRPPVPPVKPKIVGPDWPKPPKPGIVRQAPIPGGGTASYDASGKIKILEKGPMTITRSQIGIRQVRVEKPDRSIVFVGRGGHGFVQRERPIGGRPLIERTYFDRHGVPYARFYRPYGYHGVNLVVYAPVRYYPPAYYSWAYYPQGTIPYTVVPAGYPAAGYYGPYFTPGQVDSGPPYWLTDYMVSKNLADAYQAQVDDNYGAPPPPLTGPSAPIDPQVKQAIAEEVQRQITRESNEAQQVANGQELDPASSGLGRMLDTTSHVFITGADLEVTDRGGQCSLSPGDVIQLAEVPASTATAANLVVLASKPRECVKGDLVSVNFSDLQEMQNHMRETIDDGLAALQTNTGLRGWPVLPQQAKNPGRDAPFAADAPPPEPNVAAELAAQA